MDFTVKYGIHMILISISILIHHANGKENFLVSKSNESNLTYCITDSEYAISWISTNFEENPQQVSYYIPNSTERKNIQYNTRTTKTWSLQWNMDEVILDRRWEEIDLVTSKSNYKILATDLNFNFDVPFSVRAKNAHIFLCDGLIPTQSNCYVFSLENINQENTIIKKGQCKKCGSSSHPLENEVVHHSAFAYISLGYWSHLKLSKRRSDLSLAYFDGNKYTTISEIITDLEETHLIVHSEAVNSFWKIHKVKCLYTTIEESRIIWENFLVTPENREICVEFFYLMCDSCELKLKMSQGNETLDEEIILYKRFKWSKIRFIREELSPGYYTLSLSTVGNDTEEQFWAINGMRECKKIEFRTLQSYKENKCQLMSGPKNVISIENPVLIREFEGRCSNYSFSFGNTCIPLQWFYDPENNGIQMCFKNDEKRIICAFRKGQKDVGDDSRNKHYVLLSVLTLLLVCITALTLCFFRKQLKKTYYQNVSRSEDCHQREKMYEVEPATAVSVNEFMIYLAECDKNNELERQHKVVFDEYFLQQQYEETRKGEFFGYIDMVYTKERVIKNAYIATELITDDVAKDFWKIVWDDNVEHIILQLSDTENIICKKYWPEDNEKTECFGISVQLIFEKAFRNFYYRKFILYCEDQVKEVDQVQFPYDGLNPRKYVPFLKRIQKFRLTANKPILVHSSNGIANVGLILLCDMTLRMAREGNVIDVLKNLRQLANCNIKLAGNIVQYKFAHTIISNYLSNEGDYEHLEQNYSNY